MTFLSKWTVKTVENGWMTYYAKNEWEAWDKAEAAGWSVEGVKAAKPMTIKTLTG